MADERTYIRVHDGIEDHPKIVALSDKAFRVLVTTWGWCSKHRTDGRIPLGVWRKRGTKSARDQIVAAGLAEVHTDHVVMHDYLEHQRSAGEIAEKVEAKKRGARLGNHNRWHAERGVFDAECEFCREGDGPGPGAPDGSHERSLSDSDSDDEFGNESNLRNANHSHRRVETRSTTARNGNAKSAIQKGLTSDNGSDQRSLNRSDLRSRSDRKTSPETETETDKEEELRDFSRQLPVGDARPRRRGASGPHAVAAAKLVRRTLGRDLTSGTLTALTIEVAALLAEVDEPTLVEALERWNDRPGIGPRLLGGLVDDIRKERRVGRRPATAPAVSTTDAFAAQFLGVNQPPQPALRALPGGA